MLNIICILVTILCTPFCTSQAEPPLLAAPFQSTTTIQGNPCFYSNLPSYAHLPALLCIASHKAAELLLTSSSEILLPEASYAKLTNIFSLHAQRAQATLTLQEIKRHESERNTAEITRLTKQIHHYTITGLTRDSHDVRCEKRAHALHHINNNGHTRIAYSCTLSSQARAFALAHGINAKRYEKAWGNTLQCVLFDECRTILEEACQQSKDTKCHAWVYDCVATVHDVGFNCTIMHAYDRAIACNDWCFTMLAISRQLITGVTDGIRDSALSTMHALIHPFDTAYSIAQLGTHAAWCTARLLAYCNEIITLACNEPHAITDRTYSDYTYLKTIATHLYDKARELSVYDWARFATAQIFDRAVTGKLLLGLSRYTQHAASTACNTAINALHHTAPEAIQVGILHGAFDTFYQAQRLYTHNKKKISRWINKRASHAREFAHAQKMCERFTAQLPRLCEKYCAALKATQDRIVHIAIGEVEKWGVNGCHTMFGLKALGLKYTVRKVLPGGALIVDVLHPNIDRPISKTLFPQRWGFDDIFDAIKTAQKNTFIKEHLGYKERLRYVGKVNKDSFIEFITEKNGKLVTAYPVAKKRSWNI